MAGIRCERFGANFAISAPGTTRRECIRTSLEKFIGHFSHCRFKPDNSSDKCRIRHRNLNIQCFFKPCTLPAGEFRAIFSPDRRDLDFHGSP